MDNLLVLIDLMVFAFLVLIGGVLVLA
jgi:hypothetical protein